MTAPSFRLERETAGAKALADLVRAQFGEDDELLADAIEGETGAMEAVSSLLRWMNERAATVASLKALEADYAGRRKRYEDGIKAARAALATFMDQTALTKFERPEGTLSMRTVGPSVIYPADLNPEALPEQFRRWICEADKTAIREAMMAGEEISGLTLSNGGTTLALRVK